MPSRPLDLTHHRISSGQGRRTSPDRLRRRGQPDESAISLTEMHQHDMRQRRFHSSFIGPALTISCVAPARVQPRMELCISERLCLFRDPPPQMAQCVTRLSTESPALPPGPAKYIDRSIPLFPLLGHHHCPWPQSPCCLTEDQLLALEHNRLASAGIVCHTIESGLPLRRLPLFLLGGAVPGLICWPAVPQ